MCTKRPAGGTREAEWCPQCAAVLPGHVGPWPYSLFEGSDHRRSTTPAPVRLGMDHGSGVNWGTEAKAHGFGRARREGKVSQAHSPTSSYFTLLVRVVNDVSARVGLRLVIQSTTRRAISLRPISTLTDEKLLYNVSQNNV